jgi:hypothetical protein
MNQRMGIKVLVAVALLAGVAMAADGLQSGPPVGEELPGTFQPVNITGPDAGSKTCIFCEYGESPVAMVFARTMSEPLTRLTKRLDAATAKEKENSLASCVIFLSSEEGLPKQIKQLAEREKIQHTILRTFKPEGPKDYNLAKNADVIVVLFTDRVVKARHGFARGDLKEKDIDAIVSDLARILPAKK